MSSMSRSAGIALALAVLAPVAANAQDYGGIKDYRNGAPIPAPVPIYEHFRWYLRADIGGGFTSKPSVRESGMKYGTDPWQPLVPPAAATDPWWVSGVGSVAMKPGHKADFDTFVAGGLGVGLYLTPRLRGDITVDSHTKGEVTYSGSHYYALHVLPAPTAATGYFIRGTTSEHVDVHTTTALANLYWDLTDRGGFTPYIGVGAGFAVRQVERRHQTEEKMYDAADIPAQGPGGVTPSRTYTATTKSNNVVAAIALTTGASYAVSQGMLVDFSYRYTWLGEVDASMKVGSNYSRLAIGDVHDHTLRAGLRWNVW